MTKYTHMHTQEEQLARSHGIPVTHTPARMTAPSITNYLSRFSSVAV